MKAKVIKTGEIIDAVMCLDESELFLYKGTYYQKSDLEFLPDTKDMTNEIEGWATIDSPGDDVVVHLKEPYKWKFQPEDKDEYWVSRGTKYNFADSLFPKLTPEKPQKVRITITPIELLCQYPIQFNSAFMWILYHVPKNSIWGSVLRLTHTSFQFLRI